MKKVPFLLLLSIGSSFSYSQQDEKFTMQQVQQKCAGLPLEQRAKVSVTRFNVTTNTGSGAISENANANNRLKAIAGLFGGGGSAPRADEIPPTLGDNLTAMLTNALQGVGCFRVLETLKNNTDLTGEIDQGNSKYSSKNTPKAGKQLGAQIAATGEIVEYSEKSKGVTVAGVGGKKKYIKMGFALKLVNIETRDIIASHVFRVESRGSKSVSVLGLVSTDAGDPAIAAVMEDGVILAVEYMSHIRDSLNITASNIPGSGGGGSQNPNGSREIEITLSGANFSNFNALAGILSALPAYKSMEKSLSAGIGSYSVIYTGTADHFLDALNNKLANKYEVVGFDANKIELKAN